MGVLISPDPPLAVSLVTVSLVRLRLRLPEIYCWRLVTVPDKITQSTIPAPLRRMNGIVNAFTNVQSVAALVLRLQLFQEVQIKGEN